jgi:regulator of protease activity HflC (stomatin/prohibitin superfamily)
MITQIPQGYCRVLTRFGKPVGLQRPGLAFNIPFIDKPYDVSLNKGWNETIKDTNGDIDGTLIEVTEQISDIGRAGNRNTNRTCFTKDNVKLTVNSVISWRIVDPIKAIFEVDNLHASLQEAALNAVRSEVGAMDLDEALQARSSISDSIIARLADTFHKWGLMLNRVEIQELEVDDDTSKAMLQQMESERKSRAITATAKGESEKIRLEAEAAKDAKILKAEGDYEALKIIAKADADYIRLVSEEMSKSDAREVLLAMKAIQSYELMANSIGSKVFIPTDRSTLLDIVDKNNSNK